jgi:hypothetical protein
MSKSNVFSIPFEVDISFTKAMCKSIVDGDYHCSFVKSDGKSYSPQSMKFYYIITMGVSIQFIYDAKTGLLFTKSSYGLNSIFKEADNFYYVLYESYSARWEGMLEGK